MRKYSINVGWTDRGRNHCREDRVQEGDSLTGKQKGAGGPKPYIGR